jgi:hypothetical protein
MKRVPKVASQKGGLSLTNVARRSLLIKRIQGGKIECRKGGLWLIINKKNISLN